MKRIVTIVGVGCLASISMKAPSRAADAFWIGGSGTDASVGSNWETGVSPTATDKVFIRNGGSPNAQVDVPTDVNWGGLLFNEADPGSTLNGPGKITINVPGGGTNVDVKGIESQGGERVSTINANIATNALIEGRNGHDLVFNGEVTAHTVHAYETTDVVFNGIFNHTGYNNGGDFITGSGTVHFNNEFHLDRREAGGGFGFRNGITAVFGQNAMMYRTLPGDVFAPGLDTVNLYSNATVKLEGDNVLGTETDLFSRYGGPGSGHDPNNTLNLNGFSDTAELLGTHPGANFIIDFGAEPKENSLLWISTHHMPGTYEIRNFEPEIDTLNLGTVGSTFWTALDMEISGGGSDDIEVKKSQITINGIEYGAFDASRTTPYWSLVNPDESRAVQLFNLDALPPSADFDDNDMVDGADFLVWQRGFGLTNQTSIANGDANRDGVVDGADFTIWKSAFGGPAAVGSAGSIPEPASLALLGFGIACSAMARRRA